MPHTKKPVDADKVATGTTAAEERSERRIAVGSSGREARLGKKSGKSKAALSATTAGVHGPDVAEKKRNKSGSSTRKKSRSLKGYGNEKRPNE